MTAAEIRELVRSEINAGRSLTSSARSGLWTAIGTTITTVLATVALVITFVQSQIGNVQSQIGNVQSQIGNVQSQIESVQLQITGLEDGIQSQFDAVNMRIDGVRSAGRDDIRNVGAEIRALREEGLPLAVRIANIENRLAVLSTFAGGGMGPAQAVQGGIDNAVQGDHLPALPPSPEELLWPADPFGSNRVIP